MFVFDWKIILAAVLSAFIVLSWLMITRAPVYLPRLDANAPSPPEEEAYVFGFATLTNPVVRFVVLGRHAPAEPAALRGWQRHRRDLRDAPDLVLHGVRFRVTPAEMIRLDRYERTGRRYRRDLMELEDGSFAWVYRLMGEAGLEAVMD
ncbi:gamma-glutamylcyclotransferase family protein [Roseinatronobacter sp.]|uniref:gamma-glutamylcyclotransferase family protein n=1 Tax=Roseinatronobacter sp. TaxID=1945755 RepID=UPI0025DC60AA|nr:gamma-glutamylcyclotransferase family protein [Rhodobaca sp.]